MYMKWHRILRWRYRMVAGSPAMLPFIFSPRFIHHHDQRRNNVQRSHENDESNRDEHHEPLELERL